MIILLFILAVVCLCIGYLLGYKEGNSQRFGIKEIKLYKGK